jgi:hypothetical protein
MLGPICKRQARPLGQALSHSASADWPDFARSLMHARLINASCISSALAGVGQASSRTAAMASASSAPRSSVIADRSSVG